MFDPFWLMMMAFKIWYELYTPAGWTDYCDWLDKKENWGAINDD